MRTRNATYVALGLIFRICMTAAASPLGPTTPTLSLIRPTADGLNTTKPITLPVGFASFPPGHPPNPLDYDIPETDLTLELSPLGFIRGRDELLVERVIAEAFRASLNPQRPFIPLPEDGYKLQIQGFLIGVNPSRRLPGEEALTWGMWTEVLAALQGYVQAYPGYDFSYDIYLTPSEGASGGYVIASGLAITRG